MSESLARVSKVAGGEITHMTNRHRLANGEICDLEIRLSRLTVADRMVVIAAIQDVTERLRAEARLTENEERYRLLFENMSEGFSLNEVITDGQGKVIDIRILEANGAYIRQTGLNERDIIGKTLLELNPGMDPRQIDVYAHVALRGEPAVLDYLSADLSRHFHANIFCPRIGHYAAVIEDVTVSKQNADQVHFQASLLEQVHSAVITIDFNNTILSWNKHAEDLYQWTREEAIGKNIIDLLAPEEMIEATLNNFVDLNRAGHWEGEYNVRRKDGSTIPAHITNTYLQDAGGNNIGFIGISEDITESKKGQEALLASEKRFRTIFENAPIAISLGRNGKLIYANPVYVRMHGYTSEDEVMGRSTLDFVSPRDHEITIERGRLRAEGPMPDPRPYELHGLRKDGTEFQLLVTLSRVTLADGPANIGFIQDITARKQAEADLLEAQTVLERRVQERTTELRISNQALEKALRAKDEFLAAMSHELRTPLAGILGLSQILQMPTYGSLTEKQIKAVVTIEESGERLLEVINDVLEYSKLQGGSNQILKRSFFLVSACQDALRAISPRVEKMKQHTRLSIHPEEIKINSDERWLGRLLSNLLRNATKFTAEGGEIGIDVLGDVDKKVVTICVWDSGIGIKQADFPRLFQPFVQLDASLARQYGGTGLGLALVKQISVLLGGDVSVESEVGKGSRFTVSLPWEE